MIRKPLLVALALLATSASAVEWRNVDEAHHVGGRKASEGYLQGKVVLVCRDAELMPRMELLWQNFKKKSFLLLGVSDSPVDGCTFPVYRDAGLKEREPQFAMYMVDETGRLRYVGHNEHRATEALVTALTDHESPRDLAQWKRFLDYELENLPGRAYLRMLDFRKRFPEEAKAYESKVKELKAIEEIRPLAELVNLSRKLKDFAPKKKSDAASYPGRLKSAIEKYSKLKESTNPKVSREAKNAIADLVWALAAAEKK